MYHLQQPNSSFRSFSRSDVEIPIHRRFEQMASQFTEKPAIIKDHVNLSYAELKSTANHLWKVIIRHDLQKTPIGILSDNGIDPVIAILAVLKAGRPFVLMDVAHPLSRLKAIMNDAGIEIVLCSTRQARLGKQLTDHSRCCLMPIGSADHSNLSDNPGSSVSSCDPACIVYTSGSTGTPKGIFHLHRNIMHSIMRSTNSHHITPDDRWLLLANPAHMGGINGILRCILNGATVYLYSFFQNSLNSLEKYMTANAITVFHAVPSVYRLFIKHLSPTASFPDLRLLLVGGEAMFKEDVNLFQKHFTPPCKLVNHIGCTEFSGYAEYVIDHDTVIKDGLVPVGFPAQDTELAIVDDHGRSVQDGQVGNIEIRSEFLAEGYWQDPQMTRSRFLKSGEAKKKVYRPGDIGKMLPDGCLVFMGRNDSQVHIRGNRVEIIEIETALLSLSAVNEARVVPFSESEHEIFLAAYITALKDKVVEGNAIKQDLRTILPDYMIPERILVIDKFPLNTNGKLDLKQLPHPANHEQRFPSETRSYNGDQAESRKRKSINDINKRQGEKGSQEIIENRLCRIWEKTLKVASVGAKDNFFEIGGNSIRALKLFAKIEKEFEIALPVHTIFQFPDISRLAKLINAKKKDTAQVILDNIKGNNQTPIFWLSGNFDPGDIPIIQLQNYWQKKPDKDVYGVTIEEMAAAYVKQIKGYINDGPFCLGGYSIGGLLALETARQFENEGYKVPLLFLVDPAMPGQRFEKEGVKVFRYLKKIFDLRAKEKLPYISRRLNNLIRFSNFPFKHALCRLFFRLGKPLPFILHMYYAHKLFQHASSVYNPREYTSKSGRVSIYISNLYTEMKMEKLRGLCPEADIDIINTDDHQHVVKPPWNRKWLTGIQDSLDLVGEKSIKQSS